MTRPTAIDARAMRKLLLTLAGLLSLTGLSWALSHVELGGFGMPVALGIAALKALLVVAFFMEVADRGPTIRLVILTTVAFISLICLGIVGDIVLR